MWGKTLKVVEYNLTFGTATRMVNIFGLFKYKKNNNLYVVYSDDNTKYEIVYYGSSHVKNNNILSMTTRGNDTEIIKDFINKLVNNEDLSDFEFIDLKDIDGIEIIASSKLEIKLDIIRQLEELTIPGKKVEAEPVEKVVEEEKKIEETVVTGNAPKTRKVSIKLDKKTLIILIVAIVFGGGLILLTNKPSSTINKKVICIKEYEHEKLEINVTEENTYVFTNGDSLNNIKSVFMYKFDSVEEYQSFINKGTFYKYMPEDTSNTWDKDDNLNTFTITSVRNVDSSYKGIREYEEVIKSYSSSGYNCTEKIEEE